MSIDNLAMDADISMGTVIKILYEDLNLSKKSASWVPHLLTNDQKKK